MKLHDTKSAMIQNNGHVLLAVLAHPDDETFGLGGTLALYARKGVAVYLVCATRGEQGRSRNNSWMVFNPLLTEGNLNFAAQQESWVYVTCGF